MMLISYYLYGQMNPSDGTRMFILGIVLTGTEHQCLWNMWSSMIFHVKGLTTFSDGFYFHWELQLQHQTGVVWCFLQGMALCPFSRPVKPVDVCLWWNMMMKRVSSRWGWLHWCFPAPTCQPTDCRWDQYRVIPFRFRFSGIPSSSLLSAGPTHPFLQISSTQAAQSQNDPDDQ